MAKLPPLDDAMRARFAAAREAERIADLTEPRARDAYFDRATGRIVVELKQGGAFAFPPRMYPELASLSAAQLAAVRPFASGEALEWEEPDVHIAVAGVLVRLLGPAMLRAFAQRGGSSTSEKKAAAARANGARGGRPRTRTEPGWSAAPPGYGVIRAREQRLDPPAPPPPAHADPPEDVEDVPPSEPRARRGRKRSGE